MLTLDKIAHIAMEERGFIAEFPKNLINELAKIEAPAKPRSREVRDLRELLWVSIDNDDSKDLDQITYAKGDHLYVAIADVDALVKKNGAIDAQARHNTTSVYSPGRVFPMLPLKLSNDFTSLNPNTDRCANVIEMKIGEKGDFNLVDAYPAWVRNQAQLTYNGVGSFLEGRSCLIHPIPPVSGLLEQLKLQDEMAQKIQQYRNKIGALNFRMIELEAHVVNGIAVELAERDYNRAHSLIENAMIAANVCTTRYLTGKGVPTLRRIVRIPKRWDRIVALARDLGENLPSNADVDDLRKFLLKQQKKAPALFPDLFLAVIKLIGRGEYVPALHGKKSLVHFNLAEHEYAHTTAPNRRFPDLVMQRLLKGCFFNLPIPSTMKELEEIGAHCTEKENDADKVERRMIKCAAAMVMAKQIGKEFKGMVTGASPKGTWVRLVSPAIEGKVVKDFNGLDVGDFVRVKLSHVDVLKGHIDFQTVK